LGKKHFLITTEIFLEYPTAQLNYIEGTNEFHATRTISQSYIIPRTTLASVEDIPYDPRALDTEPPDTAVYNLNISRFNAFLAAEGTEIVRWVQVKNYLTYILQRSPHIFGVLLRKTIRQVFTVTIEERERILDRIRKQRNVGEGEEGEAEAEEQVQFELNQTDYERVSRRIIEILGDAENDMERSDITDELNAAILDETEEVILRQSAIFDATIARMIGEDVLTSRLDDDETEFITVRV
jgi:hypothetical protein